MKRLLLTLAAAYSWNASAHFVDTTGPKGSTTIQIQKSDEPLRPVPAWEVHDGSTDIESDSAPTTRDARDAWKKACEDWKRDFRRDNKDNKIINMSCGHMECSGDAGDKTCTSKAVFKIKTRVDQP